MDQLLQLLAMQNAGNNTSFQLPQQQLHHQQPNSNQQQPQTVQSEQSQCQPQNHSQATTAHQQSQAQLPQLAYQLLQLQQGLQPQQSQNQQQQQQQQQQQTYPQQYNQHQQSEHQPAPAPVNSWQPQTQAPPPAPNQNTQQQQQLSSILELLQRNNGSNSTASFANANPNVTTAQQSYSGFGAQATGSTRGTTSTNTNTAMQGSGAPSLIPQQQQQQQPQQMSTSSSPAPNLFSAFQPQITAQQQHQQQQQQEQQQQQQQQQPLTTLLLQLILSGAMNSQNQNPSNFLQTQLISLVAQQALLNNGQMSTNQSGPSPGNNPGQSNPSQGLASLLGSAITAPQQNFSGGPTNNQGPAPSAVAPVSGNASGSGGMMQPLPATQVPSFPQMPQLPGDRQNAQESYSNYPMDDITNPGQHDVLLGRGSGASNHLGNIKFRFLVNQYKDRYGAASRVDKPKVAQEVVNMWRNLTPPGRFLARFDEDDDDGQEDDEDYTAGRWRDVGNSRAKTKTCQCLREKERPRKAQRRSI